MPTATKTLQAIDRAVLAGRDTEHRKHLGASVIGHKCGRQIFYKWRWALSGQHEARLLRLFNRGHREEAALIKLLRDAGVTVYDAGENGEFKAQMRVTDVDGHFGGTCDGIAVGLPDLPKDTPALLEFKTFNYDQFQKLVQDGVMTAKWEYFIQMQIYMDKMDLGVALFLAVCKDNDELYAELVYRNSPQAQHYVSRAKDIIYATEPPPKINQSPGYWICKFCDFNKICHFEDAPEINCRTCVHASPGPAGTWTCERGLPEIETQLGCGEHIHDPRFFEGWTVTGGDFEENWIQVHTGVAEIRMGPRDYTSKEFFKHGLIPF